MRNPVATLPTDYDAIELGWRGRLFGERLSVDLGVLLPGFVRTQGEKRVIHNALEGLKSRVEYG